MERLESVVPPIELLPAVLELLPVGVWIMDQQGQITHGNRAGREIWAGARYVGPERFGEYKGWWADSGRPIAADEWAAARAIRDGTTSLDELIDIECFDGTRKTILNSAMPLRDEEGRVTGAIIINQDVTARHKAELDRERLVSELQAAVSEVRTLAGLLPICAGCRQIRDGEDRWQSLEAYVAKHASVQFSHGLCPECLVRLYPDHL